MANATLDLVVSEGAEVVFKEDVSTLAVLFVPDWLSGLGVFQVLLDQSTSSLIVAQTNFSFECAPNMLHIFSNVCESFSAHLLRSPPVLQEFCVRIFPAAAVIRAVSLVAPAQPLAKLVFRRVGLEIAEENARQLLLEDA